MDVVGIDVSKADFHACLLQDDKRTRKSFPNTAAGYRQLKAWLRNRKSTNVHACMEATGAYWLGLAKSMHDSGVLVSVVNPSRTALFARSQLRRTKTDVVDADMIADFCRTQKPPIWEPPAQEILELRALLAYREHLVGERIRFKQLGQELTINAKLKKLHTAQLRMVDQMLDEIEQQLRTFIGRHQSLQNAVDALESIDGIGFVTAVSLVTKLPVQRLRDGKAAAAYAGLTPSDRQSGTSVRGKPRLCKTGNASLRRDLYMPALSAIRYNRTLSTFAKRLKDNGKPSKVIIAAVMRKLVVLAFTTIRQATAADPIAA